ncbi:hypothetical protein HDJEFDLB_04285 [Escherichia coli]
MTDITDRHTLRRMSWSELFTAAQEAEFQRDYERARIVWSFALHVATTTINKNLAIVNRPGFPGECFICELRLPDHRFRWKHNKLFLLLPEEYGPAFPAIVDCYTSPPT